MKNNKILLICALALGLPSVVSNVMHNETPIVAKTVESIQFIIDYNEFIGGGYAKNDGPHTKNNIEFYTSNVMLGNNKKIQFKKNLGYINNTIEFENSIKKITINEPNGSFLIGTSNTKITNPNNEAISYEPTSKTDKYFCVKCSGKSTGYATSITIEFYLEEKEGNKITFDTDGGNIVQPQYIVNGNTITKPTDPIKEGYRFLGWYYNDQLWDFTAPVTGEMTLIAKWGDLDLVNIIDVTTEGTYYKIQGEVIAKSNNQTIFIQDNTSAIQAFQKNAYFGKVEIGDEIRIVGKYALFNSNRQLSDIIKYEIISSDGKVDTQPLTSIDSINKENANKYISLKRLHISSISTITNQYTTLSLENYEFLLYYNNQTFVDGFEYLKVDAYVDVVGAICIFNDTLEIMVNNVVESQRYNVSFYSNGGTNIEEQKVFPGEKITKPTNPTKQADGYTTYEFAGWFTDSGLTQEYDFNSEVNEDITLYAKWNSKTLSSSEIFTTMQTKSKLSAKYTKNIEEQTETVFEKVTTDLKDWSGTYLITYNDSICFDGSLETLDKTSNTQLVSAVDNRITGSSYLDYIFTFEKTTNNNYSIQSKSGYYIGRTSTSNGLDSSKTKKYDLSISYNNGISIISSKCYLNFNEAKDQTRFRFFKNEQSPIDLYKLVESKTSYTITDASIRYGATIPSAAYDENANYGLLVTSGTLFDVLGETMTDLYSIADANEDNKVSKEEFISALDINLEIETTDYNSLIPVKTDANGKADENGEYYQFGINFTSALNHIDTKLCAIAYMEINGEIFITKETNYSLRTLAQKYIDEKILADNEDATSVLNAIVSYKK